ncbi:MAG: DUF480 domain-containing protein [Pseudomonadota bacterium]
MLPVLNDVEVRVLGCLLEKSKTTPDQYPLTLNALTNACNQKSSREPVMSLSPGEVQHAVRELENKHLLRADENFRRGVEKYTQRFCNTSFSDLQFGDAEYAIVTLLLLRGPQTPGELRSRSGRLHSFEDNAAVVEALSGLAAREPDPLVVKLPRIAGRKDSEYVHLLSGAVDVDAYAAAAESQPRPSSGGPSLAERVTALEAEVAELRALLRGRDDS